MIDIPSDCDCRSLDAIKWTLYPEDVIPMWIADMDFPAPPAIRDALIRRAQTGYFTYRFDSPRLREVIVERLARLYHWHIEPQHIVYLPGLVTAFAATAHIYGKPDRKVLTQPPVYPPFLSAASSVNMARADAPLVKVREGSRLRYEVDFDVLEAAMRESSVFLLCNPHNPVGRMYTREELTHMAELADKYDVLIVSDEIHADLVLDGRQHVPLASISPEAARRTITLMSPSKTYNIAGLFCGFAIIPDDALRNQYMQRAFGLVPPVNVMGYESALAGYEYGDDWLHEVIATLQANRDTVSQFVADHMPGVAVTHNEATYLAWLDFSALPLPDDNPHQFMLEQARVGLSAGKDFGAGSEKFLRMNFATSPERLMTALEQMRAALATLA